MRELTYPSYPAASGPRLFWPAIAAGTAVSAAVTGCLILAGLTLGLLDPAGLAAPRTLGPAGGFVLLVSCSAGFFAGGWTASRLSDSGRDADGMIYGLVTWAAAACAGMALFALSVGAGRAAGALGTAELISVAAAALAAAAGGRAGARLYLPVPVAEFPVARVRRGQTDRMPAR